MVVCVLLHVTRAPTEGFPNQIYFSVDLFV